jgi:hypothetical protein
MLVMPSGAVLIRLSAHCRHVCPDWLLTFSMADQNNGSSATLVMPPLVPLTLRVLTTASSLSTCFYLLSSRLSAFCGCCVDQPDLNTRSMFE